MTRGRKRSSRRKHGCSHHDQATTELQIQPVDERRMLNETSAGEELQTWECAVQETKTEMREAKRQSNHESLRTLEEEIYRCKSEIKRSEETMKDLRALYSKQVADIEERQVSHYKHPFKVELPRLRDQALEGGQTTEVAQYGGTPDPPNELVLYRPNDMPEVAAQDLSVQMYPKNPIYPTRGYSGAIGGSIVSRHNWDYSQDLSGHHSRFRATGFKSIRRLGFKDGQLQSYMEWDS